MAASTVITRRQTARVPVACFLLWLWLVYPGRAACRLNWGRVPSSRHDCIGASVSPRRVEQSAHPPSRPMGTRRLAPGVRGAPGRWQAVPRCVTVASGGRRALNAGSAGQLLDGERANRLCLSCPACFFRLLLLLGQVRSGVMTEVRLLIRSS